MKSSDVIVIGAGIIGLSLAWELRKHGLRVQLLERGEPGREASHAAAGMIAVCDPHNDAAVQVLAERSAALYPEFVHEIEDESGTTVDFRDQGTITFLDPSSYSALHPASRALDAPKIRQLEPAVVAHDHAYLLPERWVDPRRLCSALLTAYRHRSGDLASGSPVDAIEHDGNAFLVKTEQTTYRSEKIVNCCGAWAGQLSNNGIPTRPVKGQMLSVVPVSNPEPHAQVLHHVIRAPEVYLVPRSDGRIIIGSTLEECGFDKQVNPDVIHHLHEAAAALVPAVKEMRIHEVWTGLRPGTPDGRPLMGTLAQAGSYIATGHYRDGILLAPATAQIMTSLLLGKDPGLDLRPFAPNRFQR